MGHFRSAVLALFCAVQIMTNLTTGVLAEESDNSQSNEASSSPLKGGVVKVEVTLNDLRDARLSTSRLRKAVADLYDEVTRQQVTMTYNPNVVGTTVISIPTPSFTGAYLPARKKWVKASMAEIGPIITLLKEDVDAAIESDRHADVSEEAQKAVDPLRDEVFALVKKGFNTFKELEGLTEGSSYNNNAIASAANNLDSEMKELDRSLKKGIKILQKEAKLAKKTKVSS